MFNKSKDNILKQIYDISLLDEPVNLEPIDDIPQNRKLQTIYYNLLWGVELKLPKFDGIKSLLIFLEYFDDKFMEARKISPHLLSRKTEIFYLLIEQILKFNIDEKDKDSLKTLEQFFYEEDFFASFLIKLNKLNYSHFTKQFLIFSKVSYNKYYNLLL